jgi:hypothetical protein
MYDDYIVKLDLLRDRLGDDTALNVKDKIVFALWRETLLPTSRGNTNLVAKRLVKEGLHHVVYTPVSRYKAIRANLHYLEYVPSRTLHTQRKISPYRVLLKDLTRCVNQHLDVIDLKLLFEDLTS